MSFHASVLYTCFSMYIIIIGANLLRVYKWVVVCLSATKTTITVPLEKHPLYCVCVCVCVCVCGVCGCVCGV